MATIEITWTMAAAVTGWAVTAAGLIKVYWRKSLDWDHAEKHHKLLLGDPDKLDLGLVHRVHVLETNPVTDARVRSLENDIRAVSSQVVALSKALNAYGSDEAAIIKAIHEKLQEVSWDGTVDDPFPSPKPKKTKQP